MRTPTALVVALMACGTEPATHGTTPPACDPAAANCGELPPRAEARTCLTGLADGAPLPSAWSATGCGGPGSPGPELVPYEVAAPLWSDGARKARWIVLDPGDSLGYARDGGFTWPLGAALVKEFAVPRPDGGPPERAETRVMVLGADGWRFASYVWSEDGSDAVLAAGSVERPVDAGFTWRVPGPEECAYCHLAAAPVLGPRADQLALDVDYGGLEAPQLEAMDAIGLLSGYDGPPDDPLVDPYAAGLPVERRARAWLHANCAHCHQPGGWTPPDLTLDLRYELPLAETYTCDVPAQYWSAAWSGRDRIAPGDPDASELYLRVAGASPEGVMPPYGATVADTAGIGLLRAWIAGLVDCD